MLCLVMVKIIFVRRMFLGSWVWVVVFVGSKIGEWGFGVGWALGFGIWGREELGTRN